jgi:hypothetical protein
MTMSGARRAVVIILAIVAVLNIGYGVYRQTQGGDLTTSFALFVAAVVCVGLAGLLWLQDVAARHRRGR